jgi:hypothetical protein
MRLAVLLVAVLSACSKTPEQKLPAAPPTAQPETTSTLEKINAEARAMDTLPQAARFTPAYAARFDSLRKVEAELVGAAARR